MLVDLRLLALVIHQVLRHVDQLAEIGQLGTQIRAILTSLRQVWQVAEVDLALIFVARGAQQLRLLILIAYHHERTAGTVCLLR